jgi:hypothetical protein
VVATTAGSQAWTGSGADTVPVIDTAATAVAPA